jgi:membrane protease YdiL (CAAX protease family)
MYDRNSKGISYTAGFFILIAFAIAGLIIGAIISIPVWTAMTGTSALDIKEQMKNPAFSDALKTFQAISTFFGFLVPAILAAFLLNRKPYRLLGFSKKVKASQVLLVIAVMFSALFVSGTLGYLNEHIPLSSSLRTFFEKLEREYNEQVKAIMQLRNFSDYLFGLLIMGFLPALCEESLFRGGLQNFLTRATNKPWLAILIVSVIFSVVHFSYFGFLPRMFLGIMLGLIYYYTGSLWLSILGHFFNNAVAVTLMYYYFHQGKTIDQAADQSTPWLLGVVAIPLLIVFLSVLRKISPQERVEELSIDDIRNKAPWQIDN